MLYIIIRYKVKPFPQTHIWSTVRECKRVIPSDYTLQWYKVVAIGVDHFSQDNSSNVNTNIETFPHHSYPIPKRILDEKLQPMDKEEIRVAHHVVVPNAAPALIKAWRTPTQCPRPLSQQDHDHPWLRSSSSRSSSASPARCTRPRGASLRRCTPNRRVCQLWRRNHVCCYDRL